MQELQVIDGGLARPKKDLEEWEVHWHKWAKELIQDALAYQDMYNIKDIEDGIHEAKFQLWFHPSEESAYITEIVEYPRITGVNLLFCAGKFSQLEEMLPSIEQFTKFIGGERLWGGGRPGWSRAAKHLGFKKEFIISKDL